MITSDLHLRFVSPRLPPWAKKAIKAYCSLTSRVRSLPDYLIIGSRRCGTTSLYNYLVRHPGVMPAMTKEIFYFTEEYERGKSWYTAHFPTLLEKRIWSEIQGFRVLTGEATAHYIRDPRAAERVRQLVPDVKLLVVLRNPVDAFDSSYRFGITKGAFTEEQRPFDRLVEEQVELLRGDRFGGRRGFRPRAAGHVPGGISLRRPVTVFVREVRPRQDSRRPV